MQTLSRSAPSAAREIRVVGCEYRFASFLFEKHFGGRERLSFPFGMHDFRWTHVNGARFWDFGA